MTCGHYRVSATRAGPFVEHPVDYAASSPFIAFYHPGFAQAGASGRATLSGSRKSIPITFTSRRVTGAGVEAENILRNLRVEGPLFLEAGRLFSDQLRIRSDKVNGRLGLTRALKTGVY